MYLEFETKAGTNGDVYGLKLDLVNKTFRMGYYVTRMREFQMSRKKIEKLAKILLKAGWKITV